MARKMPHWLIKQAFNTPENPISLLEAHEIWNSMTRIEQELFRIDLENFFGIEE